MSGGKSWTSAAARILVGGAAVLVLCLVTLWLVAAHDSGAARRGARDHAAAGTDEPTRPGALSPSASPDEKPPGSSQKRQTPPPKDKAVAGRTVSSYLEKVPEVLSQRRKANQAVVARIGTPVFADELQAGADYNRANGVRVVGRPSVSQLDVLKVDLHGRPPTAVVEGCIDGSTVHLVDGRGRTVAQPRQGRTRERFSLVWSGSRWLIDSQEFPDDPTC